MNDTCLHNDSSAFLSLLCDKDESIASLAMDKLLSDGTAERFMAEAEDSADLMLRKRVQQMAVVMNMRKLRETFIRRIRLGVLDIWDAAMMIDQLYDPQSSTDYLMKMFHELEDALPPTVRTLGEINEFMVARDFRLQVAPSHLGYYLLGDVLEMQEGSALALGILIHQLCRLRNVKCSLCIYSGRIALVETETGNVLDLQHMMDFVPNVDKSRYNIPADKMSFIRAYLANMLASSIAGGDSWDTYFSLDLISRLDNIQPSALQYPLGTMNVPGK